MVKSRFLPWFGVIKILRCHRQGPIAVTSCDMGPIAVTGCDKSPVPMTGCDNDPWYGHIKYS